MKLKLTADSLSPLSVRVWLDDKEITDACDGVQVMFQAGNVNSAVLYIRPDGLEVQGDVLAMIEAQMEKANG